MIINRILNNLHEPNCCCEFNPSTDKLQDNVLGSDCCPVHNLNPIECQSEPKCKHCLNNKQVRYENS